VALGQGMKRLASVAGSAVESARVALLVDEESAWAFEQGLKPHRTLKYSRESRLWHAAFWNRQVLVDVLPADTSLDDYALVVVPSLYIVGAERADRIARYVDAGGTALVTYLSGIVDASNRVLPGGYPGAFREILGAWSEEFRPLQLGDATRLDDGSAVADWTEDTVVDGAEPVIRYLDGDGAGRAAVTHHRVGAGNAWYVSAALQDESAQRIVDRLIAELALPRTVEAPAGVEAVTRRTETGDVLFLINHTSDDAEIAATGVDLLTGNVTTDTTRVPAGQVVALQKAARA
jgi:beta-galactosidase